MIKNQYRFFSIYKLIQQFLCDVQFLVEKMTIETNFQLSRNGNVKGFALEFSSRASSSRFTADKEIQLRIKKWVENEYIKCLEKRPRSVRRDSIISTDGTNFSTEKYTRSEKERHDSNIFPRPTFRFVLV